VRRRLGVIVSVVTAAAALTAALAPLPPAFVERWYSRRIYPPLQDVVTLLSSAVPISLLDVTAGLLLVAAVIFAGRAWRRRGLRVAARHSAVVLVVTASIVYLWFLLFWGFNYRRVPLEEKLAYDPSRVTVESALAAGRIAVERVNALRPRDGDFTGDDEGLARALAVVTRRFGAASEVRVAPPKPSVLQWYFRKAAIDGMTDPWFLEIVLNPDLLPFERPFVLAHEWAHLAGYADESEANFVALLACVNATPVARYSGWLAAYEHLVGALPREERRALRASLGADVRADLDAAAARYQRSSPTVRTASRGAYDAYLRANRIEEGIANYNAVVRLMLGTVPDGTGMPPLKP
jgi:hypothetical protein